MRLRLLLLIAGSTPVWIACSQAPSGDAKPSSTRTDTKTAQTSTTTTTSDKCKDFPVAIYPSHTSLSCETGSGSPLRQTAYISSADSVEKVAAYYKTQVQPAGWTVSPMEVESATRAVVVMKKGKGYATAVINPGVNDSGSRVQIHAYPNGNE